MILIWCKKIYCHKTIFQFDLYLKQKTIYETVISSWHWIHDCIMMKYFHGVWKFTIQRGTQKISSTLFFFLQFTKINYQQSDKWSFYLLLPFLLSKRISMLLMTSSEEYRRQRMTNIKNEFQKCMHIKLTPNCEEYLSNLEAS